MRGFAHVRTLHTYFHERQASLQSLAFLISCVISYCSSDFYTYLLTVVASVASILSSQELDACRICLFTNLHCGQLLSPLFASDVLSIVARQVLALSALVRLATTSVQMQCSP